MCAATHPTKRITNKRKQSLVKNAYDNRGRKLKAELFPQLGIVLENIFQLEIPTKIFCDLIDYMKALSSLNRTKIPHDDLNRNLKEISDTDAMSAFFEIWQRVKIRWTANEIGDSRWRSGWYVAEIQRSDIESDIISIVYASEPDCIYEIEVIPPFIEGKLTMWKKKEKKER